MKKMWKHPEYIPLLLLAVVFAIAYFTVPGFNQFRLLLTILKNGAYNGIIALGILPVLICGDIDLSVGAQLTFYGVLCGVCVKSGWPLPLAVCLTLAVSVAVGCVQGALIAARHLNSILATIATSLILIGLSSVLSGGVPVYNLPERLTVLGSYKLLGLSVPTLVWFAAALVVAAVLYWTYWGRFFYAVGCNQLAADKAGVPILQTKTWAFALCGLFCGVCSVAYISQLGFAPLANGQEVNYSVLTIAALGGVSFAGGRGKVAPVLVAGLMLSALTSLFIVARVPPYYQNCIKGAILFVAILTKFSKP